MAMAKPESIAVGVSGCVCVTGILRTNEIAASSATTHPQSSLGSVTAGTLSRRKPFRHILVRLSAATASCRLPLPFTMALALTPISSDSALPPSPAAVVHFNRDDAGGLLTVIAKLSSVFRPIASQRHREFQASAASFIGQLRGGITGAGTHPWTTAYPAIYWPSVCPGFSRIKANCLRSGSPEVPPI